MAREFHGELSHLLVRLQDGIGELLQLIKNDLALPYQSNSDATVNKLKEVDKVYQKTKELVRFDAVACDFVTVPWIDKRDPSVCVYIDIQRRENRNGFASILDVMNRHPQMNEIRSRCGAMPK